MPSTMPLSLSGCIGNTANNVLGYRLSPLAERDLEEIWSYTARTWSREQADRYHADIVAVIEDLAKRTRTGQAIDDIRSGYFKYAVGQHFVFYRFATDLDIVRVLRRRMDVVARL